MKPSGEMTLFPIIKLVEGPKAASAPEADNSKMKLRAGGMIVCEFAENNLR